ncbi:hypothetical protein PMIN06_009934 [Paraphaeosphaeria minitans]|uniref:Chromatin structure-remodeling complex protein RSC2 n=1 Tax=Paraphaeosphaeria minitans TaxID=565426 RepID=A0A9P6GAG8_9PLEO|nr:chromatin structure-remodeling complex protein RSC2 [Paraphaeosphaeria minitans]
MASGRAESDTPMPTTETAPDGATSTVTAEEWKGMADVLTNVYAHRIDDGYDPTKLFQRKVNKRALPDYYEVIKEPMALSEIKKKVALQEYKSFPEFVRDFAHIPHNAQVYNRQDSQAYVDALEVKKVLEQELRKLADAKIVSEDVIKLPYLGEIPEQDPLLPEEEEDDEEDDEEDVDEELEEVDVDDDEEDDGKRRKRRGPRSTAAIMKREGKADAKEDPESRKKRGRPPRVDTPMEARIKAIMKAIRKPRNTQNKLMVSAFERVPDKAAMPEYHAEIKSPMAMDVLKRKLKRKKYNSVDHFMQDVELMFENAKQYNEEDSQIYKDAVHLQTESRKVAEQEKAKDDSKFVMEEGRIPMPTGILHNGELWKVGDWVHIQNANDLTKPIVAQIYRTWQDAEGSKWVNACWYYRPEQTVHRFDRHFLDNEVVKTGQYRDHPIDEVVDRCFVMFVTRYNKGRPRDFPTDKEIYVCEARYNEENHKLNKIKTWASCLPDEVRDKDYVMDLFDAPRKLKKIPSPIAYLLKDEQKETDDLPKPEWGAENAPPKIGAVHRRPRDPRDSPPPEPTPSPPPQPPPAPVMPTSSLPTPQLNGYGDTRQHYPLVAPSPSPMPAQTPQLPHMASAYGNAAPTYHNHSQSPAPHSYQTAPQSTGYQAITPSLPLSTPQPAAAIAQYATPRAPPSYQQPAMQQPPGGYRAPQPVEVYVLPDHANLSIPADVREQFQRDEQGRVLFFTVPPANDSGFVKEEGQALGHSARYLAMRAKRDAQRAAKRKADEAGAAEREEAAKKRRKEVEEKLNKDIALVRAKALDALGDQLALATKNELHALLGNEKAGALARSLERLAAVQGDAVSKRLAREAKLELQKAAAQKPITGMTVRLEEKI